MEKFASKLFLFYEDNIQNKFLSSIKKQDIISLINVQSGAWVDYLIFKKVFTSKNNNEGFISMVYLL